MRLSLIMPSSLKTGQRSRYDDMRSGIDANLPDSKGARPC
jgi:hypothetical protein